ncbi:Anti-sigma factor [Sulfidibacter corallicola]|uniref:Anti-sigma factor n=1 Tax=Sulfidibacter corallicola TaxID=2818388 RepID=A0A8A4TLK3_SULCO|nr:anti-sigma factor [Sulfidibacter corallicola]QTD50430.1 anti-sigma factor [Sulfidibacter corallicola]
MTGTNPQYLQELIADQATGDLDRAGRIAFEGLLTQQGSGEAEAAELAVAAAMLCFEDETAAELPNELRDALVADADLFFGQATDERPAAPPRDATEPASVTPFPGPEERERRRGLSPMVAVTGWLVAAVLAAIAFLPEDRTTEPVVTPEPTTEQIVATSREDLLRSRPSLTPLPWSATEDDAAKGASGDVVWSADDQTGFMRIRGLAANDPSQVQYQLWIFDKDRDERYPIDGGVFDVPAGQDEVIIPIRAPLDVLDPQLYAITVERPGGVVVSARERIVLVAKPSSG